MEKEITQSNITKEQELKELYNSLAHQNDKDAIINFFEFTKEDRNQKIKSLVKNGKKEPVKVLMDFGKR